MSELLFHYYKVHPTTWVYLSSLLMLGLYFKFSRFWSVRNLDLVLLILLAPGLLLVQYGREAQLNALGQLMALQQLEDSLEPGSAVIEEGEAEEAPGAEDSARPAAESEAPSPEDAPADIDGDDPAARAGPSQAWSALVVQLDDDVTTGAPAGADPEAASARSSGDDGEGISQVEALMGALRSDYDAGRNVERLGFYWLLAVAVMVLVRTLIDPTMVRRPLLEPNLSIGGLTFIGVSLFVFLMANVITSDPTADDLRGPQIAERLLLRQPVEDDESLERHGPGYALLNSIPAIATMPLLADDADGSRVVAHATVARLMAILSHLAIVLGIVAIGYRHFDNLQMGIGVATLYLMLPYTAQMTGRVDHVLPAALLVWAVLCYRRPLTSGVFIGLAMGVVYYPLFLLPLWLSFYWQRGLMRFTSGVVVTLAVMVLSLALVSTDTSSFLAKVQQMFGLWTPATEGLGGIWGLGWDPVYRLPILTAFIALSGSMALWPAQKNLGTLLSCSSAIMVATQFWHGYGGGIYMAWYLPLLLLMVFRPNLEDRVALVVLGKGWFPRRPRAAVERAA